MKIILSKYNATAELLCVLGRVSTIRSWTTTGAMTAAQAPAEASTEPSTAAAAGRELKLYQTHAR